MNNFQLKQNFKIKMEGINLRGREIVLFFFFLNRNIESIMISKIDFLDSHSKIEFYQLQNLCCLESVLK